MEFNNAPAGWRLKSSKKIYDNYFLKLYEDMLDINGKDKLYVRGLRRDYSTIVPFTSDGKILIINSYRHLVDSTQIEVPSGYIDEGENAQEAAVRELNEETGYIAKKMVPLGNYTVDYSMFVQRGHIFAAYDLAKEGEVKLGRMEKIEPSFMPIIEVKQLLSEGKILNAASIVALYRALDYHESMSL